MGVTGLSHGSRFAVTACAGSAGGRDRLNGCGRVVWFGVRLAV
jgi:hypothetical protein